MCVSTHQKGKRFILNLLTGKSHTKDSFHDRFAMREDVRFKPETASDIPQSTLRQI